MPTHAVALGIDHRHPRYQRHPFRRSRPVLENTAGLHLGAFTTLYLVLIYNLENLKFLEEVNTSAILCGEL